jgi:5-(carboxyamino)imidazole ribonucleotide mutase
MIILGSASDYKIAKKAISVLEEMEVPYDLRVASAHRTHGRIKTIMTEDIDDIEVFIAIAGLAAHLPGVIASYTTKPVIAVPVDVKIGGIDALISSIQMQLGTPIATVGIDRGDNAAWLACQIVAYNDKTLKENLNQKRHAYNQKIEDSEKDLIEKITTDHYTRSTKHEHVRPTIDKTLKIPENTEILIISDNYSNIETVHKITRTLDSLNIANKFKVISATREPDTLEKYMKDANEKIELYLVVSGLSTILSGAVVSHTTKPVIGVPCSTQLNGIDSLLSMIEMPPGVPVGTVGLDAGENAALFAARILSVYNKNIENSLKEFMKTLHKNVYYQ